MIKLSISQLNDKKNYQIVSLNDKNLKQFNRKIIKLNITDTSKLSKFEHI